MSTANIDQRNHDTRISNKNAISTFSFSLQLKISNIKSEINVIPFVSVNICNAFICIIARGCPPDSFYMRPEL